MEARIQAVFRSIKYDSPNTVILRDLPKVIKLLKLEKCCGIYGIPNECLRQI
jgi:hypothetical protein